MAEIPVTSLLAMTITSLPWTIFALFLFLADWLNGWNILWLYYWVIIMLIIIILVAIKYFVQDKILRTKLNLSFRWSQIFTWVSYLVASMSWYEWWFPIRSMIYPTVAAWWSDAPPFDTLPLLFVNMIIWWLISYWLILLIPSRIRQNPYFKRSVSVLWIIITIYWFGMLIWIFD